MNEKREVTREDILAINEPDWIKYRDDPEVSMAAAYLVVKLLKTHAEFAANTFNTIERMVNNSSEQEQIHPKSLKISRGIYRVMHSLIYGHRTSALDIAVYGVFICDLMFVGIQKNIMETAAKHLLKNNTENKAN